MKLSSKKTAKNTNARQRSDRWFESGAMPYAQYHYPFEREGDLKSLFPAQFIAEGLDQTRGWFYTLLIWHHPLRRKPYRNVVVNGLVLAEDGKMKRLKNYPDPNEVLEQYGADALRAYLINRRSSAAKPCASEAPKTSSVPSSCRIGTPLFLHDLRPHRWLDAW